MTTHGAFHWNELLTWDVEKAKDFYGKSLGWTFEDMPMPDGIYTLASCGGKMVGGIFPLSKERGMEGIPEHWLPYIAVDDLDKRLKLLVKAGGKVMREPFDIPGTGVVAMVTDANGAGMGWMVPAEGLG